MATNTLRTSLALLVVLGLTSLTACSAAEPAVTPQTTVQAESIEVEETDEVDILADQIYANDEAFGEELIALSARLDAVMPTAKGVAIAFYESDDILVQIIVDDTSTVQIPAEELRAMIAEFATITVPANVVAWDVSVFDFEGSWGDLNAAEEAGLGAYLSFGSLEIPVGDVAGLVG